MVSDHRMDGAPREKWPVRRAELRMEPQAEANSGAVRRARQAVEGAV
jgi:hypothetical protein